MSQSHVQPNSAVKMKEIVCLVTDRVDDPLTPEENAFAQEHVRKMLFWTWMLSVYGNGRIVKWVYIQKLFQLQYKGTELEFGALLWLLLKA